MKKVLSFVLAVVMVLSLSTVAFAWSAGDVDKAIQMKATYTADQKVPVDNVTLAMIDTTEGAEGKAEKYVIGISTGDYTADDFSITAKVKKGGDVVKVSVKEADKKVEIAAIPDYSWGLNKSEKFEVVVTVKPAAKEVKDWKDVEMTVKGIVVLKKNGEAGDMTNNLTGASATPITGSTTVASGSVIKVSDAKVLEDVELSFTFGNTADCYMIFSKLYDHGAVNVTYNNDSIKAIQKANLDASIEVYNFVSAPEFEVAGKLFIEADEDKYIYEVVDGKPVASKFAWDDEEYAWALKTNVLGCYIVSDKELEVAADAPVANPSTGASDMVNVAVAMAVVSIAAAGAVALKK